MPSVRKGTRRGNIISTGQAVVAGFHTLSAADIPFTDILADLAKRVPRYPTLPLARTGRQAVDERYRGMKLGSVLLFDAVQRSARSDVAVFGMLIAPLKRLLGVSR